MKRILHIIPSLAGGGAERQLGNIIGSATKNEFSHCVCTFNESEFFAPIIRESGHQVYQLNTFGNHPWFSATTKINSIIREYKPDVITTWLFDASIVGRLISLLKPSIPLVCTLHSTEYEPETIRAGNWSPTNVEGRRLIDKLTTQLTNPYFTACSNGVKKSYSKTLSIPNSRIKVIYNGVEPELLKCDEQAPQRLRQEAEIPADGFIFISVGNLTLLKNYSSLLKAFKLVLAAIPQSYLVIVGIGSLEQKLKDLAVFLNIDHRVRFLGERKDVGACLEMADVFVMPSLFEGHPLALVEAMFKKLPSIVSDIEAMREVLTDNENGLLFHPNKLDELAAAMIKLFHQPELRERLGKKASEDAERRFHIRIIASEWEDYYRNVISENKPK